MGKCSLGLIFILALVSPIMFMVIFMTQPLYPWGKRLRFPFNTRLEGAVGL